MPLDGLINTGHARQQTLGCAELNGAYEGLWLAVDHANTTHIQLISSIVA